MTYRKSQKQLTAEGLVIAGRIDEARVVIRRRIDEIDHTTRLGRERADLVALGRQLGPVPAAPPVPAPAPAATESQRRTRNRRSPFTKDQRDRAFQAVLATVEEYPGLGLPEITDRTMHRIGLPAWPSAERDKVWNMVVGAEKEGRLRRDDNDRFYPAYYPQGTP